VAELTSRIIAARRAPLSGNIKIEKVLAKISEHFESKNAASIAAGIKPRPGTQRRMKEEMMAIVELVIAPQLARSFRLDLSDDFISARLEMSERRAKYLRSEMKDAGLIFFPEYSKPKKAGDYPIWMLEKEFIVFVDLDEAGIKVKKSERFKKYKPLYFRLYTAACKDVYQELEEYDICIDIRTFMNDVYKRLNAELEFRGLTKEMLLK
jgi:hypothetical protein